VDACSPIVERFQGDEDIEIGNAASVSVARMEKSNRWNLRIVSTTREEAWLVDRIVFAGHRC
jgi:hypothetical protein